MARFMLFFQSEERIMCSPEINLSRSMSPSTRMQWCVEEGFFLSSKRLISRCGLM